MPDHVGDDVTHVGHDKKKRTSLSKSPLRRLPERSDAGGPGDTAPGDGREAAAAVLKQNDPADLRQSGRQRTALPSRGGDGGG